MNRKAGRCENCNKSKTLYEIKKRDFTTEEIKETLHWWCMDCFEKNSNSSFHKPSPGVSND